MDKELLIVKKKKGSDKIKLKITQAQRNSWCPNTYEKIISNKDFNQLALLFYDLNNMGYPIDKSFGKFKEFLNEPELFFLR